MRTASTLAAPIRSACLAIVGAVACAACGPGGSCARSPGAAGEAVAKADCPDLRFQHRSYVEWREVHPRGILQEVGDASYPACLEAGACGGDPLHGKGATDVWQYADVDASRAVIGLRHDTHTYVVFVRVDVHPRTMGPRRP